MQPSAAHGQRCKRAAPADAGDADRDERHPCARVDSPDDTALADLLDTVESASTSASASSAAAAAIAPGKSEQRSSVRSWPSSATTAAGDNVADTAAAAAAAPTTTAPASPKRQRTIETFFKRRGDGNGGGDTTERDASEAVPAPPVDPASLEALIPASWRRVLQPHFCTESWRALSAFVKRERAASNKRVFPPEPLTFNAFALCPWHRLKVVVLGQDPYHGPGQAHGLCFSVQRGVSPPPSLLNIFSELEREYPNGEFARPRHGCLEAWAAQGVLLLNATLTVEAYKAGSHAHQGGWLRFTDEVIEAINERKRHVVFMLWGRFAQQKGARVDARRHLVLRAAHPSPLSANKGGWFGNGHFKAANEHLRKSGAEPVDWGAIGGGGGGGEDGGQAQRRV